MCDQLQQDTLHAFFNAIMDSSVDDEIESWTDEEQDAWVQQYVIDYLKNMGYTKVKFFDNNLNDEGLAYAIVEAECTDQGKKIMLSATVFVTELDHYMAQKLDELGIEYTLPDD